MKRALILVAHADDETLGCGGIIQRLVKAHWRVQVVVMADGIVSVRGGEPQDNRPGTVAACRLLGTPEPIFMGFPDQKFDGVPMADLAGSVGALDLRPDLIITHVESDLNRDHRLTLEVARIIGRPLSEPVSILGCEIPNTTSWDNRTFSPTYYVDIAEELTVKVEAFRMYANEIQAFPHPWSAEGLELLAKYHGMQSGHQYAEAFVIYRANNGQLI